MWNKILNLKFLNGIWSIWLRIDDWFSKKKNIQKNNIRWSIGLSILLFIHVNNEIRHADRFNTVTVRNSVMLNAKQEEINACHEHHLKYVEAQVRRFEEIERNTDTIKIKTQKINK